MKMIVLLMLLASGAAFAQFGNHQSSRAGDPIRLDNREHGTSSSREGDASRAATARAEAEYLEKARAEERLQDQRRAERQRQSDRDEARSREIRGY